MAEDNIVLKVEKISKSFVNPAGAAFSILQEVSLEVKDGEFLTILGPSCSGKSTLLRILAGIENPDSGSLRFRQSEASAVNMAFIPTGASSLPWLSVMENVKLGIKEGTAEDEAAGKIKRALNLAGLDGYENHIPANKSTGFRFRISAARALVTDPKVILIDDALRAIKPGRKIAYYRFLRELLSQGGVSILYVTNDITEALLLSDRILLFGRKPARIVKEFSLPEKGPVEAADSGKEEYNRIRQEFEKFFYESNR